ncbi:hypothetical protein A9K55_001499 [Cordyceps militaris]|uniref:C2H2-type domain-containing protein n=1 Tax=Cordyceps militaris TaxID=73501 RepID=A0A2H4SRC6_CORMI|nr:hypothetical protein A9K55_001499 [Cordyceps militaris]
MTVIQEPTNTEDLKVLIENLLERLPEAQRSPFLHCQLSRFGIRDTSSEPTELAASASRTKRGKKPAHNSQRAAVGDSPSPRSTSGTEPARDKEGHQCGFCKEMNHVVVCARKNDLKRHMGDFHHVVTEFRCPVQGCKFQTESKKQFSQHIKTDGRHKQIVSNNEIHNHEVTICEPIIFACGFANCSVLLEAPPAGDNGKTFRDYIEHVIKHYDEDQCAEWSYETRIQSLLRQSRMQGVAQHVDMRALVWDWKHSTELRRELITGNIMSKEETLQRAFSLGSGNYHMNNSQLQPMLTMRGRAAARGQDIGRRRQRLRKNQANASISSQYDFDPSYQTHVQLPESLVSSELVMRRSADPSLSPATYSGSVHNTPPTPLGDAMSQVYARGSQEVFMGAEAIHVDPRMHPGMPPQQGYAVQRELPSGFLMSNGFTMDSEQHFLQQGLNHQKF